MRHKNYATAWLELAGKIAPEILTAPKTGGDKSAPQTWPVVHMRTVRYLDKFVVSEPWANHLALAAAVLSASNRDVETVYLTILQLHKRLKVIFQDLQLQKITDWDPDKHIPLYIKGDLGPEDTVGLRSQFVGHYVNVTKILEQWLISLPPAEQQTYQPFILPRVYSQQFNVALNFSLIRHQQENKRKTATAAIVPHFADLRAEAHLRHNKLARLLTAYQGGDA